MRVIKRALCILVILALAVSIVPTSASASSLAVVGTSLSSAGMTSAEFAASAGPYALGILAAIAAAFGIKTYVQENTGQAVKDNFMDLIRQRAADTRRSEAEEMEALLSNATIGEQGNIVLGRLSFAEAKAILLRDEIPVEKPTVNGATLGNYQFMDALEVAYNSGAGQYIYKVYCLPTGIVANSMCYIDNKDTRICFISKTSSINYVWEDTVSNIVSGPYTITSTKSFNVGNEVYNIFKVNNLDFLRCNHPVYINTNQLAAGTYTEDDLVINYPSDTLYGVDETLRGQNVGLYEGLNIMPDLINSAVLGGASGEISASDYCGALVDYVSGYDTVIDGVTVTGLPEAGTVPRSIEEAPATDTVVDEAPPSTMTGTEAAGLYSFSLDELFPFCLPFDFVKIIEKFNVEPEAPNFDWRFYIPGVIDYTLHVDLSAWNNAAEVCRTMVLIAFMVGLIMLTRQIFIRA